MNTGYNLGRKKIDVVKAVLFNNDSTFYYQSLSSTNTSFGGVFLTHSWRSCHGNRHLAEFLFWNQSDVSMVNPKTGQCNCPAGFSPMLLAAWGFKGQESGEYRSFLCLR